MKIFSKNTWGVDVNNAWPLTCKASCLKKKIELRPLISGFDFCIVGGTESVRGFPTITFTSQKSVNKPCRILMGQSKKNNPEKPASHGTQDEEKQNKNTHNMCLTPLYANNYK